VILRAFGSLLLSFHFMLFVAQNEVREFLVNKHAINSAADLGTFFKYAALSAVDEPLASDRLASGFSDSSACGCARRFAF
jgi:hypothetical protein